MKQIHQSAWRAAETEILCLAILTLYIVIHLLFFGNLNYLKGGIVVFFAIILINRIFWKTIVTVILDFRKNQEDNEGEEEWRQNS